MSDYTNMLHVHRDEKSSKSGLDNLEQIAKIASLILVPLILGIGGWKIQTTLPDNALDKDYVSLSIDILSNEKTETNVPLRKWAIKLLSEKSPIPFDDTLLANLETETILPPPVTGTRYLRSTRIEKKGTWSSPKRDKALPDLPWEDKDLRLKVEDISYDKDYKSYRAYFDYIKLPNMGVEDRGTLKKNGERQMRNLRDGAKFSFEYAGVTYWLKAISIDETGADVVLLRVDDEETE